ncbi:hypothetical protein K435DRAFT_809473 [Dendrothele bispora CBS 962.96]|uniref:Uncharacterized protein n=1 Tax=Dendrothele bispora (strain CBS 962.96) TaxID=1314807 RepID=A0A4S8KY73_DENBC|nr:hypothetical protein K435DRAFT_809473 [Dendrothele bispora CBS 962.96]
MTPHCSSHHKGNHVLASTGENSAQTKPTIWFFQSQFRSFNELNQVKITTNPHGQHRNCHHGRTGQHPICQGNPNPLNSSKLIFPTPNSITDPNNSLKQKCEPELIPSILNSIDWTTQQLWNNSSTILIPMSFIQNSILHNTLVAGADSFNPECCEMNLITVATAPHLINSDQQQPFVSSYSSFKFDRNGMKQIPALAPPKMNNSNGPGDSASVEPINSVFSLRIILNHEPSPTELNTKFTQSYLTESSTIK